MHMLHYIKFTQLPVSNQTRAVRFYTQKLGFRILQNTAYKKGWRWIELGLPGAETAIVLTQRDNELINEVPSLVLAVDDVESTFDELRAKGVAAIHPPRPAPWNPEQNFALLRDSEGNTILIGPADE
jgi:predicted enzyme related to lactoylglutathione lyase